MSNLFYEWTNNHRLSDARVKLFIDYATANQAYLFPVGDYVFDTLSLSSRTMLSKCLDCEMYQEENCCHGNSYSMPDELIDRLSEYVPDILKLTPDYSSRLESYMKYGAFTRNNATTTRGTSDKGCIFSYKDSDGHPKCAIHAWCLESGRNPAEYKPYACSMFPLNGIKLPNGRVFVFSCTQDTKDFSMFFYTLTRRICVNEEAMTRVYSGKGENSYLRSVNSEKVVKDELIKYFRPVYVEQENILRYLCGDTVYEELVKFMNSNSQ